MNKREATIISASRKVKRVCDTSKDDIVDMLELFALGSDLFVSLTDDELTILIRQIQSEQMKRAGML